MSSRTRIFSDLAGGPARARRRATERSGPDPPPFAGCGQRGRGFCHAAARDLKLPPRGGAADRASGGQGALRGRLPRRSRRVSAAAGEGRGRQRSRGLEPARPALPGDPRPRQEDRSSRAGLEGHAGGPGRPARSTATQKDEAIRRAVELTPKIREALGRAWLEESFTQAARAGHGDHRGHRRRVDSGLQTHAFDGDFRLKSLELQKLAVEALLKKAPERGKEWAASLALLAEAWLHEAEFSYHYDYSTSLGPRMQYDPYGNVYYSNYDPFTPDMMARQGGMPMAIKVGDVVKNTPWRRLAGISSTRG